MKKVISILLSLALLLSLCACNKEESTPTEPAGSPSSPLLYKVTDAQGHVLYLFGSIHIGTEDMYPLPDYVMDAYEESEVLAVECDLTQFDADDQQRVKTYAYLPEGTTIRDCISTETYQAALTILKETGSYTEEYERFKPIVWQSTIDDLIVVKSDASAELGVDQHMLELAHGDGKTIHEIESIDAHYETLGNFSMELQCLLLDGTVANYRNPYATRAKNYLCDYWAAGDETTLIQMDAAPTSLPEEERPLYQEYYDAMMGKRNPVMTQYAKDALCSGKTVFICVGISHVIGTGSMVDMLTQDGYTVERVTA